MFNFLKASLFYCLLTSLILLSCGKDDNDYGLIKAIEPNGLKQKYFDEYDMQVRDSTDSTIICRFSSDLSVVEIRIGIFETELDVLHGMVTYLSSISIVMNDGKEDYNIGEEFWWWSSTGTAQDISDIVFLRENLYFSIYSQQSNIDLVSISKEIDADIVNGADYIIYVNSE